MDSAQVTLSDPASTNQTPPLVDYNLWTSDPALALALEREGAGWAASELEQIGADLGRAESFERARLANTYGPVLRSYDPRGTRVDRIEFHPAWHELMTGIVARGFHSRPWAEPRPGAHVARAAGYLMQAQIEQGSLCPTTMTYGAVAALRNDAALARRYLPKIFSRQYDPREWPIEAKHGALIGMGMTEKQGGSDVRSNTTRARREPDGSYRLTGHKWFFSAPQCDAHLVLAQTKEGLSCFVVPRYLDDGTKNGVQVQRLKDKVGNRSNASSEVEFDEAWGTLIGATGRGVPTILEMGTFTRLDCVIGSAGMMRQAAVQALHHARHRHAFGRALIEQPLMQSVLADLVLEAEAATVLALRLARAFDGQDDPRETLVRRTLTSAAKFWVCKRGPELAAEAMEVLGGNGYVEEGPLARIYREMPVNSIWEGSGNIMCLDLLRALTRTPEAREVLLEELRLAKGADAHFDRAWASLSSAFAQPVLEEASGRGLAGRLVVLMQAALLLRSGRSASAEGFCASRLGPDSQAVYGAATAHIASAAILKAAWS